MNILLDECLPKQLGTLLPGHIVKTVTQCGWSGLKNGQLLKTASADFDVMITVDQKMPDQQNISAYELRIIILQCWSNDLESIRPLVPNLILALTKVEPGTAIRVAA